MFPFSVVEDLDVFEKCLQSILRSLESLMVNQFGFEDAEKGFGHRVIPAVTLTTHALNETMLFQYLSKILASVLYATIRVDDQPGTGPPGTDATVKCRKTLSSLVKRFATT